MRFLRWKETRPLASVVALTAWGLGISAQILTSGDMMELMPVPVSTFWVAFGAYALLLPALLVYIAERAGRATALFCATLAIAQCGIAMGLYAMLPAALILLPAPLYGLVSYERRMPFWPSVGVSCGLLLLGGMATIAMANALSGGDAVTALCARLEAALLRAPLVDQQLLQMSRVGLLKLPESVMLSHQIGGGAELPQPVREEMIRQLLFFVDTAMRQSLPSQVLQGSMLGGLLCVAWPRRMAARNAMERELAPLPPFHRWYIPRAMAAPLFSTTLCVGALAFFSDEDTLVNLSNVLWTGASLILALQGGALLMFLLRQTDMKPGSRIILFCALFVFFQPALIILGIADQVLNPRALRERLRKNHDEEDPR